MWEKLVIARYTRSPGLAGMQTRRFGGFCYFGIWVSRPRAIDAVYAAKSAYLASVRDAASDRKSRCG